MSLGTWFSREYGVSGHGFPETEDFFPRVLKLFREVHREISGPAPLPSLYVPQGDLPIKMAPHAKDFEGSANEFTWQGGKGINLLGAIRYLASEELNVFSFLTFNSFYL